jgi:DNA-binding transcriptional ArsR family regulator
MFKELDPLFQNQLRLQIMSLLMGVETADFNFLLDETGATRGNLSVQITKLKEAGYLQVEKSFKGNYPSTQCELTNTGRKAFLAHFEALKSYWNSSEQS